MNKVKTGVMHVVLASASVLAWSCTRSERIGGGWEVETRVGLPESGNKERLLYRRGQHGRRLTSRLVHDYRFYGDDCLVFESPFAPDKLPQNNIHYFVACGDRQPVLIVAEQRNEWELRDGEMVRRDDALEGTAAASGKRIPIADLKRRAMAAPISEP